MRSSGPEGFRLRRLRSPPPLLLLKGNTCSCVALRSYNRRLHCLAESGDSNRSAKRATFKDGRQFSRIINGTWQLAGGHGRSVFDHVFQRLQPFAEAGFTTFDTADIYGASEEILGQLQSRWRADGKEPLEIFTKYVPNPKNGPPSSIAVKEAINSSRRSLQMAQVDLVQLHWWDYNVPGYKDVILTLGELQSTGMIKSIGVTNFDTHHLELLTDLDVPIVSNQVQFSLMDRRALGPNGMLRLCKERDLKLLCYGVVAGGLLTNRYLERGNNPLLGSFKHRPVDLDTASLKMYWNILNSLGGERVWRHLLQALREVADKHQTNVACVAIQWVMNQEGGDVAFPIIGVRNTQHLETNAAALELRLDEDDLGFIADELARTKQLPGDIYTLERNRWRL